MSSIIMDDLGSMEYQMPLVVWPTLVFLFSYSKLVPKRALRRVDLPELCEPMMESV